MKVAIIGSRDLKIIGIDKYIPRNMTMLISGGARGIDRLAERYADSHHIPKMVFRPDYLTYSKQAPFIRNRLIVDHADYVVAIWNGKSRGTKFTIDYARASGKEVVTFIIE